MLQGFPQMWWDWVLVCSNHSRHWLVVSGQGLDCHTNSFYGHDIIMLLIIPWHSDLITLGFLWASDPKNINFKPVMITQGIWGWGGGGSGCSFWYSQVSWWGSSSEFSLPQTKITRSWNITTDLSWVFTKWSTHNTVPPVTPNLPLGRFVSCPQAASKSHVVKRYSLSILSPCTLVLSLRVMESRTKLTYQLGTILQVARSWDPMSCHWYKITSIWRDIEGLCVIFGNWGCLQLPSLLPPWPQNSRVLAVVFPWLSLACVHTVQRNEKLSEHLAYREVVSACMKKLISIEKKERVLAIYSPVFCLVMLSICSSCSAIIVCLCFIVVFFWLLSWIAFSLILALLGGIWWAQIGLLLSASVSTWRSGSISLTMEFCGVWGCVCNFTWMGTLWLTRDCVIVHKLGYWK